MEMDCIRAQATLSAIQDGEHVTEENTESARAHVAECGTCRAFESDLGALAFLPAPKAPPQLVDRVMVAVAAIAAERAMEQGAAPAEEPIIESLEAEPNAPRFEWSSMHIRRGALAAMATAAAALVLVAFLVARTPTAPSTGERATVSTSGYTPDLTFSGAAIQAAPSAPAPAAAPAHAPDYLIYKGRVYAPGALLADSATATQSIGTVTTSFGGAGAPSQVPAYRSPLTDGSIVVAGPDGSRLYTPVIRLSSSVRYQMVAGNAVERFGIWPTLPARFPVPSSPDGSPTFVAAGADALGVQAYTAKGTPQTQGFAVAPGTPAADPAGSNPNWTWWEPLLMP